MISKEHVYVITERGQRKIRQLVVKDKSADVLQVFDKHLLPNTEIMVDPSTENNHFKNIDIITQLHEFLDQYISTWTILSRIRKQWNPLILVSK